MSNTVNKIKHTDLQPKENLAPAYVSGVTVPKPVIKWWQNLSPKVIWGLMIPVSVATLYWMLIASDRYMSEATFIIKDAGAVNGELDSLSLIGSVSPGQRDALLVKEYILSWDMLKSIDSDIGLKKHYSKGRGIDIWSTLSASASREDFLEYYQNYISVEFIELSSTLTLKAQAFDNQTAQRIVSSILEKSEHFINLIGNQLAQEQLQFVNQELERARTTLKDAKQTLIEFQQVNNTFSPEQRSAAMMTLVNTLEADIVKSEAELKEQNAYLNDDAPQMVAVRARINALQDQLKIEKQRMIGEGLDSSTINRVNAEYQDLLLTIEFATDTYKAALSGLEQARIEAYQKLKHLVVVDPPVAPDTAEYPKRFYRLLTSIVLICILYGLAIMIYATVKEHRDA